MRYSKSALCMFMLNRAWSTKTKSLMFVYAEDKDYPPGSNMEVETSPIADTVLLPSIIHAKKNSILANLKGAEPSFKSEQGIMEVKLDGGGKVNQHIRGLAKKPSQPKCVPDGKKCDVRNDGTTECCVGKLRFN